MENKNIRDELIYTNDDCNESIEAGSCPDSTIASGNSDGNIGIKSDDSKCIACGVFSDVDGMVQEEQEKEKTLKDALIAAEQANRMKSIFLANMSHEIRTPINAILGMDTMILRESNQDSILEYARNVKSASETLLSLINDILDFSKIESGKMEIIEGDYRLDSVINDLVNMIKGKIEEKGLAFKINITPNLPVQLHGDEVRIKQVILNILNNAVKYTKNGSVEFNIGYEQQDDNTINLLVAVKDTGIGIKQEDMASLFSPYQRLEENANKHIEGTGLGLSITRDLLVKMNSELKVDSVYGEGSTFSFSLKQSMWGDDRLEKNQFKALESLPKEEKRELFHAKNAKILVVDDVEMNLIVIKGLLKRVQIVPECCLSGQEAIELTRNNKYDIIFLDAMMPNLSGEETLVKIRELCPINAYTPIVVLTANAMVGAYEHYVERGFANYLSKPINGEKFEKMIGQYLPEDKIEWIELDSVKENSNKESGDNSKIDEKVDDSSEEAFDEDNGNKHNNSKYFFDRSIRGGITSVLAVVTIICTILILFQVVSVKSFNSKAVVTDSTLNDSPVYLVSNGVTEDTDTWNTALQQSKAPEDLKNYMGATCSILVDNNQAFKINNWNLRLNVREELYISGFWCGKFEMHQFRNGVEIVEIVDSGNYVINTSALDHNVYIPQMMIRMLPGDYMVYIPSAENKELEIGPNQSVGIGLIAYFEENLDLSDLELTYFNKKRFVDGALFDIIAILGVLWGLLVVIYVATIVTYKHTRQEMETLIRIVLDGISREYMTLWMVDVQSKTIQLIRGVEVEEVQEAVKKAKKFENYDNAIKYYVDHYVELKDRENVWNAVKFDAIAERIKKEDFFTVNYVQHTLGQPPCYFQMAFSMTRNAKGEEKIVLAYRNMDATVKEEQRQKQQLADAFAQAQEANQAKMLFFANMSHEIRTPINAIMGMNTMIMRETGEEKTREYADEIRKSSDTLISLVDDILNVAKTETEPMEQKTTGNLIDVADDNQIVANECYHAPDAKLLVVDDVEMNLVVIKNLLKRLRVEPQTCLSGKEAVELARNQKFDIIFLDAMMPELNGEETFKMIREECEINQETPIIVVTANAIVGAKEHYLSVGFDDYISKPIDDKVLETIIQQYLPKDKVLLVDSGSNDEQSNNSTKEMLIINEIAMINGIVVEEGMKASGGAETYINVCANYYETAQSRMDMIREYFGKKDFDNYAIQTHALKSSSRLIGALELSELALKMEQAGKNRNYDDMEEFTEKLLSQYEAIRIGLKDVFDKDKLKDSSKKELSPKKFRKKLLELKELIEAFDYESAKLLFASLKEYQLPEDFMETYRQLKISMAEVNSDEIRSALEQYLDKEVM